RHTSINIPIRIIGQESEAKGKTPTTKRNTRGCYEIRPSSPRYLYRSLSCRSLSHLSSPKKPFSAAEGCEVSRAILEKPCLCVGLVTFYIVAKSMPKSWGPWMQTLL